MFYTCLVILFTGVGVCHTPRADIPLGRHLLGRHPHGQTPPLGRQYPPGRYPPGQTPPGHTNWAHPLGKQPPPRQTPPCPVHAGIHTPCPVHAGIHPLSSACWDMVNKWAVRIRLECILVSSFFYSQIPLLCGCFSQVSNQFQMSKKMITY